MNRQEPNQRLLVATWLAFCLLAVTLTTHAQTSPCCSQPAGLKWLQPPDFSDPYNSLLLTTASPYVLGDDFPCTNSGPITDIRLWGSFFNANDLYLGDLAFTFTIWSDAPSGSSRQPGNALWTQTFQPSQYNWCIVTNTFSYLV